jgi:hypothetical protein
MAVIESSFDLLHQVLVKSGKNLHPYESLSGPVETNIKFVQGAFQLCSS